MVENALMYLWHGVGCCLVVAGVAHFILYQYLLERAPHRAPRTRREHGWQYAKILGVTLAAASFAHLPRVIRAIWIILRAIF